MALKPLPMIPRRYIDPHGNVGLWDMVGEDTGEKDKVGDPVTDGPVRISRTAILAREALQRDPDRYKLDLPKGTKPGPGQLAQEERARAEAEEADAERDADPVYGKRNPS